MHDRCLCLDRQHFAWGTGLTALRATASGCARLANGLEEEGEAKLTVATADIDQCFEACSSRQLLPAWDAVTGAFREQTGVDSILVQRVNKKTRRYPRAGGPAAGGQSPRI